MKWFYNHLKSNVNKDCGSIKALHSNLLYLLSRCCLKYCICVYLWMFIYFIFMYLIILDVVFVINNAVSSNKRYRSTILNAKMLKKSMLLHPVYFLYLQWLRALTRIQWPVCLIHSVMDLKVFSHFSCLFLI